MELNISIGEPLRWHPVGFLAAVLTLCEIASTMMSGFQVQYMPVNRLVACALFRKQDVECDELEI
jgi:hypothetical protein